MRLKPIKRIAILERDGWQCHYCRIALTRKTGTVDHVIPRARGGTNDPANLVACCEPCNTRKGDMDYDAFCALPVTIHDGPLQPVNRHRSKPKQATPQLPAGETRDLRLARADTPERQVWAAITADRLRC